MSLVRGLGEASRLLLFVMIITKFVITITIIIAYFFANDAMNDASLALLASFTYTHAVTVNRFIFNA